MNILCKAALAVTALLATTAASSAQTPQFETGYTFADTNPLAEGRWVKISVNGSGMYEISYDRLREMGFENPAEVAVYGTGGQKREINFIENNARAIEDVVQPIPVQHYNNNNAGIHKLIFYAQGDRVLKYQTVVSGSKKYPGYKREALNPYSETTYYLLTDSKPVSRISTRSVDSKSTASLLKNGYSCLYHEKELMNGAYDSGEVWFGEDLAGAPGRQLDFDLTAKYCVPETNTCTYADIAALSGFYDKVEIRVNGVASSHDLSKMSSSSVQSWANQENGAYLNVDQNNVGTGTLSIALVGTNYPSNYMLRLDYWAMAYPTSFSYIADDPAFSQFAAGFNHEKSKKWCHPYPIGSKVWDVTNPIKPFECDIVDGKFYSDSSTPCNIVVFNPLKELYQVNDKYEQIENQDLHAMKQKAYDMVIYTLPSLRKYADRIADLHKEYDGQEVAVVLADQLYNEFNAGTPDAMCYRLMSKMLYHNSERRLKNVLFLGPILSDMRNIRNIPNVREALIAFQSHNTSLLEWSNPNMDFYGIMADNIRYPNRLESAPISLGVGLLPIDNDQDGQLIVDKIRAYLEKQDFSGLVNETYTIGCAGDSHIHENQSIRLGTLIQSFVGQNMDSEFALESLWLDAVTAEQGRDLIKNAMRRGKSVITYIGHAGASGFNAMTAYDAMNAGNREMGIGVFAGCDLSEPDHGLHGIGDMPVIRSRSGFIGIMAATRSVLSNHNEEVARKFATSLFLDYTDKFRTSTPTIGEVYARAKDATANNSELAYVYVGDPAIHVPVALSKVKLSIPSRSYRAGETIEVTGEVVEHATDKVRSDYNGYVTLKLMEPTRMVVTPPVTSPTQSKMDDYVINDLPILAVNGPVTEGRFTLRVPLPEKVESFMSEPGEDTTELLLLAGTYCPDNRLGGSGRVRIPMAEVGSEADPDPAKDEMAPTVDLMYDRILGVITVGARDDVALRPGIGVGTGISLSVDDEEMSLGRDYSEGVCVTNFRGSVDVSRLSPGVHTARARARDFAGNVSEEKILEFTISSAASLQLSARDGNLVAIEEMAFKLNNRPIEMDGDDSDDFLLIVCNPKGEIVAESEVYGATFTLDTSELPVGTYRAYITRNSPEGSLLHSNQVEFSVIK